MHLGEITNGIHSEMTEIHRRSVITVWDSGGDGVAIVGGDGGVRAAGLPLMAIA